MQDPPLHIDGNFMTGSFANMELLKAYTRTGALVDYLVWPVLMLHEGGPLLCKGVAQCMHKERAPSMKSRYKSVDSLEENNKLKQPVRQKSVDPSKNSASNTYYPSSSSSAQTYF